MAIDYKPEQNDYTNLTPFKTWLVNQINTWGINNFPFLESDFDKLTNYGMMMKLMKAMNDVIGNQNLVEYDMSNLFNAFTELQNYINNYFDNLDVQDEINTKLDEMAQDGSLTNLIKAYVDPIYQAFEDDINEEVSNISNLVNSAVSGMPIPVSSTSQMIDTNKLYLNTTDGYWYYYNGAAWTRGEIYQASYITDGSVTLLKLDDNIQENFNTYYSDNIDLGNATSGAYAKNNNGVVQILTGQSSAYHLYEYELTPNTIYEFTGANNNAACGLLIADLNGNIKYDSNIPTANEMYSGTSSIFQVNETGLKAYITSFQTGTQYLGDPTATRLRTLQDISNNLKVNTNVRLLNTYTNKYMAGNLGVTNNRLQAANNYDCYIYSIEKGKTYKVTSYNQLSVGGIIIFNNDFKCLYTSWEQSTSSAVAVGYEFTAESNGFLVLQHHNSLSHTIEVVYKAIELNTKNKFYGLKIGADGDSISAGVSNNISYVTQIATNNNCTLQNLSVGGGTIATNTYQGENPRHWICTSVNDLDNDCDVIMLSGGVNDYWQKVPMGEITNDYTSTLDNTTFYGALETMCQNVLNKFKTQKIVFVTYHKITNIYYTLNSSSGEKHTFKEYLDAIYEVMNKYSIPVIDINAKGRFNTAIEYYRNNYTNLSDGVHPTTLGYKNFYNDIVINELNNLM